MKGVQIVASLKSLKFGGKKKYDHLSPFTHELDYVGNTTTKRVCGDKYLSLLLVFLLLLEAEICP